MARSFGRAAPAAAALATAALATVALAAATLAAGCTTPPHWSLPLDALDRVALSVSERNPHDVWVVGGALGSGGDGLVLHYDGSAWTRSDPGSDATLWWVAPVDDTTSWAVGERGTVLELPSLAPVSAPTSDTLYGVWASAAGNVWIVGGEPDLSGVVLRRAPDGTWTDLTPAGASGAFFKVWGSADDDVWICGQTGALLHWNGSALAAVDVGLGNLPLFTVAGRNANDVYAVGGLGSAVALHYDGATWTRLSDAAFSMLPGLNGVSVDSDGQTMIVGGGGTKLRGLPGRFADESAQATRADLHAASIVGGEIFVVGGNYLAPAPAARMGVVAHYGKDIGSSVH